MIATPVPVCLRGFKPLLALSHWVSIPCCLNRYVAVEANKIRDFLPVLSTPACFKVVCGSVGGHFDRDEHCEDWSRHSYGNSSEKFGTEVLN